MADNCTYEGCDKELVYKKYGLCATHYQAMRRAEQRIVEDTPKIPSNLGALVAAAKSTDDWQAIAAKIEPVLQKILDGTDKGTAAQVSLMKDILNRAYGKPVATQADKRVASGVVILPSLNTGEATKICPNCGFDAVKDLEDEATKEIALRQFHQ